MPEESGGTPGGQAAGSAGGDTQGSNNNNNNTNSSGQGSTRNRGGRNRRPRTPRFKGECSDLEGHVYDVGSFQKDISDLFINTTKAIGEYVARNYDGADEYRLGLVNMKLPDLDEPLDPLDPDDKIEYKKWELQVRRYEEKRWRREDNQGKVFALILGQCSRTIKDRLESESSWSAINGKSDVMELLSLIRKSLYTKTTTRKDVHSLIEAEQAFMNFKQEKHMDLPTYLEKLRGVVEIYEHFGGEPGMQVSRVDSLLADPDKATKAEREAARREARESYLATYLVLKSDPDEFGPLIAELVNGHTRGVDGYPTTLSGAYDMLLNYQHPIPESRRQQMNRREGGLAFGQVSEEGRGGRGRGRGRGSGRSGRGGRGSASESREREESDQAHNQTTGSDNLEAAESYYVYSNFVQDPANRSAILPSDWLLMDSGSTVNLICTRELLSKTWSIEQCLPVHCNAGTKMVSQKGSLGSYPTPVWYDPDGIANIMSLFLVSKHYRVTLDTEVDNCFYVHRKDGTKMEFRATGAGLYRYRLQPGETASNVWALVSTVRRRSPSSHALVSTVKEQASRYTRRAYEQAVRARRMQNVLMRPGSRQMREVAIRHLQGCPVTRGDVIAADDIFGPNLGSLKGKTPRRPNPHVAAGIDPVPPEILTRHSNVVLAIDIIFVNQIPFLLTTSRSLHFGTVEVLKSRQIPLIRDRLLAVTRLYRHRGFHIGSINADPEFEPLRAWFPMLNCCGADEHVPEIERFVRTVKDRVRSAYRMLPFRHVPRLVLIHLVQNAVLWLNALPHRDGVSRDHSPRYLLTGRELTYDKHVRLEFGSYVQTHEAHDNGMGERTTGAICLGPTGNAQGGHWFLNLNTGARITRHRWTPLPMPADVITRVDDLGRAQGMPDTLTFGDRHAREIPDHLEDFLEDEDDLHDGDYAPTDSDSEGDYDLDDAYTDDDGASEGVGDHNTDDDEDDSYNEDDEDTYSYSEYEEGTDGVGGNPSDDPSSDDDTWDSHGNSTADDEYNDQSTIIDAASGDEYMATSSDDEESLHSHEMDPLHEEAAQHAADLDAPDLFEPQPDIHAEIQGVADDEDISEAESQGVGAENQGVDPEQDQTTLHDEIRTAEAIGREAAERGTALPRRNQRPKTNPAFEYINMMFGEMEPEAVFTFMMGEDAEDMLVFVTEQMSAKKGLKRFGQAGADAIMKELEQLIYMKVMEGRRAGDLTREQKKAALRYLMFLKQKRCGRIKGRGCADGRKQRLYKSKDETSSPTVSIEALFLTCVIDAMEGRNVITCDIPGAFTQTDVDELIHIKLEGELADLLTRVEPSYREFVTYERGKMVIYAELSKALYGTLQASYLFWKDLTKFLVDDLGFEVNPYDWCVANKEIDDRQCTVAWYVDDLKISHVDKEATEWVLGKLQERFGKEKPLSVTRGPVHEYLGMKIDYSKRGEVMFSMTDYVEEVLSEVPAELLKGVSTTPAAGHLFAVNPQGVKLDAASAVLYHHLVAKLLYLCKRARPDLQLAVSFLTTRVQSPDEDDYKKLGRCLRYLRDTKDLPLRLEANSLRCIRWWVDASFAVHPDFRSHTGATMTLGRGSLYSMSIKQKINTRSSTEAELVGVNDAMAMVLWIRHFLEAQGFEVTDNVVFQDNQSAMLLEKNGRRSSGKKTRHLEIRYYFVTDNIARGKMSVEYCPTKEMVADFFTKPLQGSLFLKFRNLVLNHPGDTPCQAGEQPAKKECVGTPPADPAGTEEGSTEQQGGDVVDDNPGNVVDVPDSTSGDVAMASSGFSPGARTYAQVVKNVKRVSRAVSNAAQLRGRMLTDGLTLFDKL